MDVLRLEVKRLHPDAKLPVRGSDEAAGLDLFVVETVTIPAGEMCKVATGISVQIPTGNVGFIKSRSSAYTIGLDTDGTIDSDYQGPLFVNLRNVTNGAIKVEAGKRYAQLIVQPYTLAMVKLVDDYSRSTARGENGFGSSGSSEVIPHVIK